jgi:hypothetical protein
MADIPWNPQTGTWDWDAARRAEGARGRASRRVAARQAPAATVEAPPTGLVLELPELGASLRLDGVPTAVTGAPDGSLTPAAPASWSTQTKILVGLVGAAAVALLLWRAA